LSAPDACTQAMIDFIGSLGPSGPVFGGD